MVVEVTTLNDGPDATPGDGICEATAADGHCTLRAAIEEANTIADTTKPVQILLLPGVYRLSAGGPVAATSASLVVASSAPLVEIGPNTGTASIQGLSDAGLLDIQRGNVRLRNLSLGRAGEFGVRIQAGATLALDAATVHDNRGAGIVVDAGAQVETRNSTIAGNGQAGVLNHGALSALFTTITANGGGGIAGTGQATAEASIIGNQLAGPDCASPVQSANFNLDSDGSCGLDKADDLPKHHSLLAASGAGHAPLYLPTAISPAVDSILPGTGPCPHGRDSTGDQRDIARPLGAGCDRGAIETGFVTVENIRFRDYPQGALAAGWTDCAASWPSEMAPLGVDGSGALRIAEPYAPVRAATDTIHLPAVGCAWRDYTDDLANDIEVQVTWTGIRPYEGTPLLHVSPDTGKLGLGAWPAHAIKGWVRGTTLLVGWIGNPPEAFNLVPNASVRFDHVEGVPRQLAIRSSGGRFTVWVSDIDSGQMRPMSGPHEVPPELAVSNRHGVALDTHFATPEWPPWEGAQPPIGTVPPPDGPVLTRYRIASFRTQ